MAVGQAAARTTTSIATAAAHHGVNVATISARDAQAERTATGAHRSWWSRYAAPATTNPQPATIAKVTTAGRTSANSQDA